MYIHPTQLETPRLCNCQQPVDATLDNWDLHFTIIGRESACFNTSASVILNAVTHSVWPGSCPCPLGLAHDVRGGLVRQ